MRKKVEIDLIWSLDADYLRCELHNCNNWPRSWFFPPGDWWQWWQWSWPDQSGTGATHWYYCIASQLNKIVFCSTEMSSKEGSTQPGASTIKFDILQKFYWEWSTTLLHFYNKNEDPAPLMVIVPNAFINVWKKSLIYLNGVIVIFTGYR